MKTIKRAIKYIARKRGKTLILFLLLLVLGMLILLGLSVKKASDLSQEKLRKSLGGKFSIDINYSEDNPYYHEEKVEGGMIVYSDKQINMEMVERIMDLPGIDTCDASTDTLTVIDNMKFFPGNIPVDEEFAHTMKIVGAYSTDTNKEFMSGKVKLVEGRHIESSKDKHKIIISKDLADLNKLSVGDKVMVKDFETEIVGLFEPKEIESVDKLITSYDKIQNRIFSDIQTVVDSENSKYLTGFTNIQVQVADPENMKKIVNKVKKINEFEWDKKAFTVNVSNETFENAKGSLDKVGKITDIFLLAVFIVSVLILSLVLTMWNKGRIHETGIYMALGMRKLKIVYQYLAEVIIVGIFAFFVAYFPSYAISNQLETYLVQQDDRPEMAEQQAGAVVGEEETEDIPIEKMDIQIGFIEVLEVCGIGMVVILLATGISTIYILRMQPREILTKMS